jgi:ABC-type transport system substrate-binding protein
MIWRRLALALSLSVILAGCQSSQPLQVEPQPERTHPQLADPVRHAGSPAGSVTVAYPSEPSTLFRPTGEEAAVDDLGALWGLPLLRLDGAGQVRRGLAIDWTVADPDARPWFVELTLAEGTWSDGTPVTAEDVVTTLERRRAADPARFGAIQATEVVEGRVRVAFDEHHATWPDLLVEIGGVIPAHLDDTAFEDDIPVSGGWFHLAERIPGLSLRFEAHSDSPLGPPRLQDVEVLFVPNDETALGLLDAGRVDAVLGHLSINPARVRNPLWVSPQLPRSEARWSCWTTSRRGPWGVRTERTSGAVWGRPSGSRNWSRDWSALPAAWQRLPGPPSMTR